MQLKRDFNLNDLAWIASGIMAEHTEDWEWEDIIRMMYDPDKGFKDNPSDIEEYLSDTIEFAELEDDFGDEGDDAAALKAWMAERMKDYRVGKMKY